MNIRCNSGFKSLQEGQAIHTHRCPLCMCMEVPHHSVGQPLRCRCPAACTCRSATQAVYSGRTHLLQNLEPWPHLRAIYLNLMAFSPHKGYSGASLRFYFLGHVHNILTKGVLLCVSLQMPTSFTRSAASIE